MNERSQLQEQLATFLKVKLGVFLANPSSTLQYPNWEQPVVSIILVAYNKAAYTFQCLETIKAHADVPYEVVIVDNGSSDETVHLLKRTHQAAIIRNEQNEGFVKGCNQGAAAAHGKWLLFLNNDTQITPALLSTLLRTAETTKHCGAVGAKVIFPDGQLQEAGSIIWRDGSCAGYGRGDHPFKPEYSYVREVDYCSGVCLFLKKDVFMEAGMFDERYHPGYYEETDLCMKLRELGYRIMYQPAAVVIHYEFGSSSPEQAMLLQAKHREVFAGRWNHRLQDYHLPGAGASIRAREHQRDKKWKVLVVDDRIPIPALGCGYPRSWTLLQGLADANVSVTLFPLQFSESVQPYTEQLQQMGIEVIYNTGDQQINFRDFWEERKDAYDQVLVSRPHNMREIAGIMQNTNPKPQIVYDAEALFFHREIGRQTALGIPLTEETVQSLILEEMQLMALADKVISVSERERKTIQSLGVKQVQVLGHRIEVQPTPNPFSQRQDLLFVGSFTPGSPNEDAALYFVNEVYPLVFKELGVNLWLTGTNLLDSIKNLASDHIKVTGTVPDLQPYYNHSKVFVVPTRFAAGISLKLLESMSYGVPAVVSPLIADQLGLTEDTVLIGRDPRDYADKIIACYTDSLVWERLRTNGLKFVETEYNARLFHQQILDIREVQGASG